jgi:hypothetical protein
MALVDLGTLRRRFPPRAVVAVAILAVLALSLAAWLVVRPGGAPDRPEEAGDRTASGDAAGPVPDDVLNDTEHGTAVDDLDPATVWYLQLSTLPVEDVTRMMEAGVGSDLDPAQLAAARDAASRYVAADLSGAPRDGGPWAAPARACCRDVRILAAAAAGYPDQPPLALALVVWSANPIDGGPPFDAWEASFVFLAPAEAGGYTPVDPSTVESWESPPGLGQPSGAPR